MREGKKRGRRRRIGRCEVGVELTASTPYDAYSAHSIYKFPAELGSLYRHLRPYLVPGSTHQLRVKRTNRVASWRSLSVTQKGVTVSVTRLVSSSLPDWPAAFVIERRCIRPSFLLLLF